MLMLAYPDLYLYTIEVMSSTGLVAERAQTSAIGRPLDAIWLGRFAKTAPRILPGHIELKLRERPGLVYVPYDILLGKPELRPKDEEERQPLLQRYTRSVLKSLSAKSILDMGTALGGVDLPLHAPKSLGIRRFRPGYSPLFLNVDDVLVEPKQKNSYRIESERYIFADELEVHNITATTHETPKHRLIIGLISSSVTPEDLDRLSRQLDDPVPFLGIGALNSGPAGKP
jgi:hypothetical protein